MKKSLYPSVIAAAVLWLSVVHADEPYAPKVEIPNNADPNSLAAMVVNAAKIPDKSEVEIPTYPGARVVQTKNTDGSGTSGELPYIKLLSTDPPDKIVAWYRSQLKGYTYEDVFSVAWVLWKGEGKFNGMDIRQRMAIQNVGISEAMAAMGYDEFMKGAKSVIEVTYEPGQ